MARYIVSHFKLPNCPASAQDWSKIRLCFNTNVGLGTNYKEFFEYEELSKRFISFVAYINGFIDKLPKHIKEIYDYPAGVKMFDPESGFASIRGLFHG